MIFDMFMRKRINNQTIKKDSDKIKKRLIRNAKKMVKNGMLPDSYSLASYLVTIDGEYSHLEADISNLTRVKDYEKIRAEKYAQTERALTFYGTQFHELQNLYKIVAFKAKETGRASEISGEKLNSINILKLQEKFRSLNRSEQEWSQPTRPRPPEVKEVKPIKPVQPVKSTVEAASAVKVEQKPVVARVEK